MPAKLRSVGKWFGLLGLAGASSVIMVAMAAYLYLAPLLPSAETYRDVQLETPLRIYTSDGRLIDEIGNRRNPIAYEEIPQILTDALIATEDVRFYSHPGVDLQSLVRGFYGFVSGNRLGGGSTMNMQLAKYHSFDGDNVYLRKLKEIPFALQVERELTKEEILTLYLNTVYFGSGADGIGAAAFVYYGKDVSELTLAESAMMVSVLPCPSACNPLADPDRAVARRETRLRNMLQQGMIDETQFAEANRAPVTASRRNRNIA
ncbi:MAG: transglycosylase domain-containing protein, partial [Pseudomonadales bacterium]|nr:transglycosylase domain-containing protein [Pseudomonadales bacterium]